MEKQQKPLTESTPIEKTKLEKALGLFIAEDVNMVSDSIMDDFIKPRIRQFGTESVLKFKEFLADSLIGCIKMLIFGKTDKKGGDSYYSTSFTSGSSKVNYVSYYDGEPVVTATYGQKQPDTDSYGIELRGIDDYGKAVKVRDQLIDDSKLYSRGVSVGRYYEYVGKTPNKTDYSHGWKNLEKNKVQVISYKGKWLIDLPKPIVIDD